MSSRLSPRTSGISRRAALALLPAALLALPLTAAQAHAAPAPQAPAVRAVNPVGTWKGVLDLETGPTEVKVAFNAQGQVWIPDTPGVVGEGTWWATGGNTFRYRVVEKFYEPDGTYTGRIVITARAVQQGSTIQADGRSLMYDANGVQYAESTGTFTLHRTAPTCPSHPAGQPARHGGPA
ncbi:hypothetical protein ACIO3O_18765 [Streptomyces sp. NPDC087440]|uniref:hypothetical protein n=1 Tax=Streptomyces sp. NPDC087440 TaxID=3365790 RepID=UPI0038058027